MVGILFRSNRIANIFKTLFKPLRILRDHLEYMQAIICGFNYSEVLLLVSDSRIYHFGMLITIIRWILMIMQVYLLEVGQHLQ